MVGRKGARRKNEEDGEKKGGWGEEKEERAWRERTGRSLRSSAGNSAATGRGDLDGAARATAALHGKASRFASDNGAASSSLPFPCTIHPVNEESREGCSRRDTLSDQMR